MKDVNIYIYNSVKGAKSNNAIAGYILETELRGRMYTTDGFMFLGETTRNKAELVALYAALMCLKVKCDLKIYTDNDYIKTCIEKGWPERWISDGWKTTKNKPVKNASEWQKTLNCLDGNGFSFVVGKRHAYTSWCTDFAIGNKKIIWEKHGEILRSADIFH